MSSMTQKALPMLNERGTTVNWPPRLQRELEREQHRSELIVTAVQLLVAALLAILYAITPPGFSPDAPTTRGRQPPARRVRSHSDPRAVSTATKCPHRVCPHPTASRQRNAWHTTELRHHARPVKPLAKP